MQIRNCPSPFPSDLLASSDPIFNDVLDGDGLLNLEDPSTTVDKVQLLSTTNTLNGFFNTARNRKTFDIIRQDYPSLAARIDLGQLLSTEVAVISNSYQLDLQTVDTTFSNYNFQNPFSVDISSNLNALNTYFTNNLGRTLGSGICGAFTNIFEKISALISIVKTVVGFVESLNEPGGFENFIIGLIKSFLGELLSIANAIIETIKQLAKQFLQLVETIKQGVVQLAEDLKAGAEAVLENFNEKAKKVKDFYSDLNMESLQEWIKGIVDQAAAAFEDLNPAVIALLMYRFCQLIESIQAFMQSPIQGLQTLAGNFVKYKIVMDSMEYVQSKRAIENGANRIDPNQKKELKDEQRKALNDSADSPEAIVTKWYRAEASILANNGNLSTRRIRVPVALKAYSSLKQATNEEAAIISEIKGSDVPRGAIGKIVLAGEIATQTVRRDGVDTGKIGPGWQDVKVGTWLKLLRTQEQLSSPVTVLRGASPDDQKLSEGSGVVIIGGGERTVLEIIIAASRARFSEIYVNGPYITLVDTGNVASGGAGLSEKVEVALDYHENQMWAKNQPGPNLRPASSLVVA